MKLGADWERTGSGLGAGWSESLIFSRLHFLENSNRIDNIVYCFEK